MHLFMVTEPMEPGLADETGRRKTSKEDRAKFGAWTIIAAPTAQQVAQKQMEAMSAELAEERTRRSGVERVASAPERWMRQKKQAERAGAGGTRGIVRLANLEGGR